jgi:SagB-type dehydrogenase family enzyme
MSRGAWYIHAITSYAGGARPPMPARPGIGVPLPERRPLAIALDDALERRASCRRFSGEPLPIDVVATLLAAAYGTGPEVDVDGATFPSRPVPSAGATYPLELHLVARSVTGVEPGSYRYVPGEHALAPTGSAAGFDALADVFLAQPYLTDASAILVLAGILERTTVRYGDRGYRYVLFEAGHAAQNVALAAAALETGALSLGGFIDEALAGFVSLRPDAVPLYAVAVGPPGG